MKILVFCPYYPPHTGGLENHSDEFNKYLSEQGVDITVFTPNIPYNNTPQELRYGRVKVIRFPAFEVIPNYPIPKFWIPTFWKLATVLFYSDFDAVISRTRFFVSSLLALCYAKLKKLAYIHIEHGSDFVRLSSPLKSIIAKVYDYIFGTIIFRFSDINISISQAVQDFVKKFDKRPSPIIYRGIDFLKIDAIRPDDVLREKHHDKIIISTVARLYKWKGIEFSIEAIRNLPEAVQSKIIFYIIGDGEDFKHLKSLTTTLPIKMLGSLSREKVVSILKISDIYIHSSIPGGGLSTALLEAMYCKCAVIATPNEGANEIINSKNGLLINKPSEELIQKSIMTLVGSSEMRQFYSHNAKNDILEKFSWEKSIQSYKKILHI